MSEEEIPKPKTERSIIPPIPPIIVGARFDDGSKFDRFERLFFLVSEHFNLNEELPSHIHLSAEIPTPFLEASNQKFKKKSTISTYFFCLICGCFKVLPLRKCYKCTYEPRTLEDLAILYTTSYFFSYLKKSSTLERLILVKRLEQNEVLLKKVAFIVFKKIEDILIDFFTETSATLDEK